MEFNSGFKGLTTYSYTNMTLPFSKRKVPMTTTTTTKVCFRTEKSGSLRVSVQWSDTTLQTTACFFAVVVGLRGGGGLRFAPNSAHFSYLTTMPVDATAFKNRLV